MGKAFQEEGRIAAFVITRGPHEQIRLIPEHGLTLDVDVFMDRTVSVTRVIPLREKNQTEKEIS